jgi:hypothetical protein
MERMLPMKAQLFNKRRPVPDRARANPIHDENGNAWERVLDCGAPGPARGQAALFYQPGERRQPPGRNARQGQ